jgi:hypothetical protein
LAILHTYTNLYAHQPDLSSTLLIEQKDGTWVLQIRAAMTAFEQEINFTKGANSFATPEEFQALVIEHLRSKINIKFNDRSTPLENGVVQLGHETNVLFQIKDTTKRINTFEITNSSFEDIARNQSALVIMKEGFKQQQFVLNNNNKHQVTLKAVSPNFVLLQGKTPSIATTSYSFYFMIGGGLFTIGLVFFLLKKKKKARSINPIKSSA